MFSAIVLAAGGSTRMGRAKALLPWVGGLSLLEWTMNALGDAGWEAVAVIPPGLSISPPRSVINPDPDRGKVSSLRTGLECVPQDAEWILIASVDQPRSADVYRGLRDAALKNPGRILVPKHRERRGHPVVLHRVFRDELLAVDEASSGLRGLLDRNDSKITRVPLGDENELRWDLNTPTDYEDAFRVFEAAITPWRASAQTGDPR